MALLLGLLAAMGVFLAPSVQAWFRRWWRALALPFALWAVFILAAWTAGALHWRLAVFALLYVAAPTLAALARLDFAVLLLLWLPLEFGAGAHLVPRPAQGFLHSVAYGVAILLALGLLPGYRKLAGVKYNLPRGWADLAWPLMGFVVAVPALIAAGLAIGFIPPFHLPPALSAWKVLTRFAVIFVATALPEEILFRGLLQNLLAQRAGQVALPLAAVIFGLAHLNNGPQPLPNWRYAVVATIAGFAAGKIFQKSSTVLAPALFHALVNTTKHFFF